MMFLIFSRDSRFTVLYELLIVALERFADYDLPMPVPTPVAVAVSVAVTDDVPVIVSTAPITSTPTATENEMSNGKTECTSPTPTASAAQSMSSRIKNDERSWMGPAVLILDAMSQCLLVDKAVLKVRTYALACITKSNLFFM